MLGTKQFEADFEFTWKLLTDFFKQKRIKRTLAGIVDTDVTGWEKWWQIELALSISEHHDVGDWNMEERFFTDLRRETGKDAIAVDLSFRQKRYSKDAWIFLELTQDPDWKRCIEKMLRDANKVFGAHSRSHEGSAVRSFFVAGIYPRKPKALVHSFIERRLDELEIDCDRMDTKFIADTPFSFTLF